jgi:hypothetical protein
VNLDQLGSEQENEEEKSLFCGLCLPLELIYISLTLDQTCDDDKEINLDYQQTKLKYKNAYKNE